MPPAFVGDASPVGASGPTVAPCQDKARDVCIIRVTPSRQSYDNDMLLNDEQTAIFSVGFFGCPLMGDAAQRGKKKEKKKNSPGLQACSNLPDSCHASSDTELMHLLKRRRRGSGCDKRPSIAMQSITLGLCGQKTSLRLLCTNRRVDRGLSNELHPSRKRAISFA